MPIGAVIGGMGNILSAEINNSHAAQREHAARQENYYYNEKAADKADQRTRALYHDLYSPQAQIEQIEAAGLSPSIFASGGLAGKSGVSGAQGSGASGISPNVYGVDPIGAALAASQIAKTKAETKNIEANTPNIQKQGLLIDAQVKKTLAEAGYTEAVTEMTNIQKQLHGLMYTIEQWKYDEGITQEMIESEARNLYNTSLLNEELHNQANIKTKLDNATFKDNVKYIALQNAQITSDIFLKESQVQLNNTQAQALLENLIIDWYKADTQRLSEKAKVVHMKNQISTELKKLGVQANISQNENEIKIMTSILQSLTSIVTMSMLTKGGIKLQPTQQQTQTTQSGTPPLPYN